MYSALKFLAYVALTGFSLIATVSGVSAACASLNGVWYLQGIAADNHGINVFSCTVTMDATGNFTDAPCIAIERGGSASTVQATSSFTISATCNITGRMTITGQPDIVIRRGHINGTMATLIATQGAGNASVQHHTMIKR